MLVGERCQRAGGVAVVLDEHQVPDLQHIGVVHVHQLGHLAVPDPVVVDLRARAARSGVTHLPEVVLLVEGQHVAGGQEAEPDGLRLLVARHAIRLGAAEVGGVQAGRVEAVHRGEQLPGPADGLLLEVVAEGPVAEHLEVGVVVHVLAHVLEVVVLAAGADALLAVAGARQGGQGAVGVSSAQEDGLELVHASVGEQQGRVVVGNHGAGLHEGVGLLLEEIHECAADAVSRPLDVSISTRPSASAGTGTGTGGGCGCGCGGLQGGEELLERFALLGRAVGDHRERRV